ncbi:o-succinylbenzoate--CoA ligase [Alteribacillus iranensis]|uniref:2-succinylbenzoate--CoA ligase n=1 Tax=Alteribacillus iranensis TaxID=930128 RepID=A0A1I1ZZY2_9BACI|nr:o-succinylbenzoate--CoA ligase [Alteribacillus iranensis]SFE37181.1 2-succinylbenzoyl-CoA synthetase [Alteribacillus iranensis]
MTKVLPNWLKKRAFVTPDRTAIEYKDQQYTFKQLHQLTGEKAGQLAAAGVKKGDVGAILLKNHPDTVIMIHALFYIGVQVVMLNNKLSKDELTWQLEDSQASFVITETTFLNKVETQHQWSVWTMDEMSEWPSITAAVKEEHDLDDIATVMYTSGTTGYPKGVIQTYGNHWWSAVGSALNLGLSENDSWYCSVPVFHISGLSILMRSVIYGMTVILAEKFSAKEANWHIHENGVTIMSVVPTMLNRMVHELGESIYPSSFRCMLLGGGPAPESLLKKCKTKKIPVFQSYGMTETSSQIVTLSPDDSLRKLGSAGKALMPSQVRINTEDKEAKPGEEGEILVKGPNVTRGYLNNLAATEKAIHEGWFYTGDIGYLDKEGFLYVLDRRSDLIISGGENIYPAEIESVLSSFPAVQEAGVIGKKDEEWGEVPVAFVVVNAQSAETIIREIKTYCEERLASYKVPRKIIPCNKLPRNAAGKLLRRELRKTLGDQDEA